jgi:hypothetical protein
MDLVVNCAFARPPPVSHHGKGWFFLELGDSPVAKALVCALAHLGSILIGHEWLIFSILNELVVLPAMVCGS